MRDISDSEQPRDDGAGGAEAVPDLLDEELLVEEVSIDGMCGVY
ncbi:mycofactocin precursor MftA [Actinomadura madurae]|uniref:Mycofactocin n=1 Tax=Actinomadura madurae TaxID=1993 RepID=A0A1I5KNL4_9ACTN|nr:mycofactocin precursor MftA [Actinomadura madurae]SFO86714.1 mycofactocin precursor [Actinomadura madurae]SPT49916.1 mycofactocin precursor [Actinomadura madurae]